MEKFPIIAIGASSGGLRALRLLLAGLSESIPAAIAAVIHIGPHSVQLPEILRNSSVIPVRFAKDGETLQKRVAYLAPPDRHLLFEDGHLQLSRGPRENFTRPAVDPLFRSAAELFGPLAIGIVLSGNLSDGTAGLWEIKRRGGIAIVQKPDEAEYPGMPSSAAEHVDVDYCIGINEMGGLVSKLVADLAAKAPPLRQTVGETPMSYSAGKPVALICPECGGAMQEEAVGTFIQYRCHVGHIFGRDEMAAAQLDSLERNFGASLRLLKERIDLCRDAAKMARSAEQNDEAESWQEAADEAEARIGLLTDLLETGWKRPELE
jgi:two-component system chemotaxis response regulator CheB